MPKGGKKDGGRSFGPRYDTMVCIIPPESAWPQIQHIRLRHDTRVDERPPLVPVLYPFVPMDELDDAVKKVQSCAKQFTPAGGVLRHVNKYSTKENETIYVELSKPRKDTGGHPLLTALQRTLLDEFPESRRSAVAHTPLHLKLGQWVNESGAPLTTVQDSWKAIEFLVDRLFVLKRDGSEKHNTFHISHMVALGGHMDEASSVMPMDWTYIMDSKCRFKVPASKGGTEMSTLPKFNTSMFMCACVCVCMRLCV